MDTTEIQLQAVKSRIALARGVSQPYARDIILVAVSKTVPAPILRAAYAQGQRDFGESYLQEALPKIEALADLPLVWHYIGPLQSNKTRLVAEHFDWVHALDRLKIAERLSAQRPAARGPLNVCIQVNLSGEASKSGVAPDESAELAHAVAALPNLRLRGLMTLPEATSDKALTRSRFDALAAMKDALFEQGLALDTLSMGMSDDLEEAVAAGSTMLRIGTAISVLVPPAKPDREGQMCLTLASPLYSG
jgi:pyridoxal phosphate enzyme (YggS family)